nr:hypothetical protein [uncultured Draconibacterium sp.]
MKTYQSINLFIISVFFVFSSCSKEDTEPYDDFLQKDTITTINDDLRFKIYPMSDTQFRFSILNDSGKNYELLLMSAQDTLLTQQIDQENIGFSGLHTDVSYQFNPNQYYGIVVSASYEEDNTIIQEKFSQVYQHQYRSGLNYQKLADIDQLLDVDITPQRDAIFYEDYVNNQIVLKRLLLKDSNLEVLDEDFPSTMMRSIDTANVIFEMGFYDNRYLGKDSIAVVALNLNTNEHQFLGWGSGDYGRYSRIVNNNIFISNPVETGTVTRIDLSDHSSQEYSADIRYLNENNYDNIYLNGEVYDFNTSTFNNLFPSLGSNYYVGYSDAELGYSIVVESFYDESELEGYSRFLVYKDDKIVYEQPYEKELTLQFPSLMDFSSGKIVFYKGYDFSSYIRFDGYYTLNLRTRQVELLQNDDDRYIKRDFFINKDSNSFISVRPYQIYKITRK